MTADSRIRVRRVGGRCAATSTSLALLTGCVEAAAHTGGGELNVRSAAASTAVVAPKIATSRKRFPEPPHRRPEGPVQQRLDAMSLRDKVRQLLVVPFSGTTAPPALIRRLHPGGLIYFEDNLRTRKQIKAMSARSEAVSRRAGTPLLVMTDQEGGTVTRIPGTAGTPGGSDFAGDSARARGAAVGTGQLLHRLGILVNLAPVADVNTVGSAGVIGPRSFSSDPRVVSRLVHAQICGYHRAGVAAAVKHFPGHGSTSTDSHETTAAIAERPRRWRAVDLPPFRRAVDSHVDMVMVGHLAFPDVHGTGRPATISGRLTRQLLRHKLHFRGVVITDAFTMGGVTSWGSPGHIAVRALRAGADLLLMPPQPLEAVRGILRPCTQGA